MRVQVLTMNCLDEYSKITHSVTGFPKLRFLCHLIISARLSLIFSQPLSREEVFVTSKLWNTKHDPEDVEEACRTSLAHLGLSYLDLYLMHWPMAFQ